MIEIDGVRKAFGAVRVLQGINLRVEPGEFFCLLGPSGCGKTTLLRLVAGLEAPDAGAIRVGGRDVTALPPHRRGCAMVFQSYALWPHLTVGENIAYGLEVQKRPRDEVRRVLEEALRTYRLEGLAERLPHEISGGQQQRVTLARAMAVRPEAVLMDEPLSNLDAALRKSLRRDLLDFHRRAGNTILYVTHDQEEALALSDRIALLMDGAVAEVGDPRRLYARPERLETALFLGDMNVFREARREGGAARVGGSAFPLGEAGGDGPGVLCIRPEHVRARPGAPGPDAGGTGALAGTVRFLEYLGTHGTVGADTPAGPVLARVPAAEAGVFRAGDPVALHLPSDHLLWYPAGTGASA